MLSELLFFSHYFFRSPQFIMNGLCVLGLIFLEWFETNELIYKLSRDTTTHTHTHATLRRQIKMDRLMLQNNTICHHSIAHYKWMRAWAVFPKSTDKSYMERVCVLVRLRWELINVLRFIIRPHPWRKAPANSAELQIHTVEFLFIFITFIGRWNIDFSSESGIFQICDMFAWFWCATKSAKRNTWLDIFSHFLPISPALSLSLLSLFTAWVHCLTIFRKHQPFTSTSPSSKSQNFFVTFSLFRKNKKRNTQARTPYSAQRTHGSVLCFSTAWTK